MPPVMKIKNKLFNVQTSNEQMINRTSRSPHMRGSQIKTMIAITINPQNKTLISDNIITPIVFFHFF